MSSDKKSVRVSFAPNAVIPTDDFQSKEMGEYSQYLKTEQDKDTKDYGYGSAEPDPSEEQRENRRRRMMEEGGARKSSLFQISQQALQSGRNNLRMSLSNKAQGGNKAGRERGRCRRFVIAITILLGTAAIILSGYFFFVQGGTVDNLINLDFNNRDPDPEVFAATDPNAKNRTIENSTPWETTGRTGLQLQFLNALERKWWPYFNAAINDWDNGYPDAVSLTSQIIPYEFSCSRVTGAVKVCNGDYNATGWRGIAYIYGSSNGYIRAVTALMNEFYTGDPNQDDDEMQYVMCHEMGHALGLLHADMTFGNPDLGTCLDYTREEQNNRQPNFDDYDFLFRLYGLVPGAIPYQPPTVAPVESPTPAPLNPTEAPVEPTAPVEPPTTAPVNIAENSSRNLRSFKHSGEMTDQTTNREKDHKLEFLEQAAKHEEETAEESELLQQEIDSLIDWTSGTLKQPKRWRLLHSHEGFHEAHHVDLDDGHFFQVHRLIA